MKPWFTNKDWQSHQDIACYDWYEGEQLGIWKIKQQLYLYYWYQSMTDYYEYFLLKLDQAGLDQLNHDRSVVRFIFANRRTNCQIIRCQKDNEDDEEQKIELREPTVADLHYLTPITGKIDYDYITDQKLPKDKLFFEYNE